MLKGQLISKTIEVGTVLYFKDSKLLNTDEPHYFIVVAKDGSENFLIVSTTQYQTILNHLTRSGIDLNTMTCIEPNVSNGLKQRSYFNCNNSFEINDKTIAHKADYENLKLKGRLSEDEYQLLKESILLSKTSDIPKSLLKYE